MALLACGMLLAGSLPGDAQPSQAAVSTAAATAMDRSPMPVVFEPNLGQTEAGVPFLARASGVTYLFEPSGPSLHLRSPVEQAAPPTPALVDEGDAGVASTTGLGTDLAVVRIRFVGAAPNAAISAGERAPGHVNYLLGGDPTEWVTRVPVHEGIRYHDLWPGIDLTYRGDAGSMKGAYLVSPGADPHDIRWRYNGAYRVRLTPGGDLWVDPGKGFPPFVERAPVAWQVGPRGRSPVSAAFVIHDDGSVGFALGPYDAAEPLVIDPTIDYVRVFGGPDGFDIVTDAAVDDTGNTFVAGHTSSRLFPTQNAAQEGTAGGGSDLFVAKLRADGEGFHYATYLGGSELDNAGGLAVDDRGRAYVAGFSRSRDFPTTSGAYQESWVGEPQACGAYDCTDGIVASLSADGASLKFSTFIGGSLEDQVQGLSVGPDGTVYAGGLTASTDLPVTQGAVQTSHAGAYDAWVARFSSDASGLIFLTYLGGRGRDMGWAGATVDPQGNAVVFGSTDSDDFPTEAALQDARGGGSDLFLAKVAHDGQSLLFSTYLGGASEETGTRVITDDTGDVLLAGYTHSPDFPTSNGVQTVAAGSFDAFATKIAGDGSRLLFSTLLGGSEEEFGTGIAVDANGWIHLSGSTRSPDFPVHRAPQSEHGGTYDAFLAKFDPVEGRLEYATWIGGEGRDFGSAVGVDDAGQAHLVGQTASILFPSPDDRDPLDVRPPPVIEPDAFVARVVDTGAE